MLYPFGDGIAAGFLLQVFEPESPDVKGLEDALTRDLQVDAVRFPGALQITDGFGPHRPQRDAVDVAGKRWDETEYIAVFARVQTVCQRYSLPP